jgi:hypothetical protein
VAVWHTEAEDEKRKRGVGEGVGSACREVEKRGAGGRQGARPVEAMAGQVAAA